MPLREGSRGHQQWAELSGGSCWALTRTPDHHLHTTMALARPCAKWAILRSGTLPRVPSESQSKLGGGRAWTKATGAPGGPILGDQGRCRPSGTQKESAGACPQPAALETIFGHGSKRPPQGSCRLLRALAQAAVAASGLALPGQVRGWGDQTRTRPGIAHPAQTEDTCGSARTQPVVHRNTGLGVRTHQGPHECHRPTHLHIVMWDHARCPLTVPTHRAGVMLCVPRAHVGLLPGTAVL